MKRLPMLLMLVLVIPSGFAQEIHVAIIGKDTNPGTVSAPLRTIQAAADLAQPGAVITVHEGIYRERINPPRGGESDAKRIVYQAAPGEKVEIKGSEIVTGWQREQNDVWSVTLPASLFGKFNPFADEIHGDWFNPLGRKHHTGAVYLNGQWLTEAKSLDEVTRHRDLWFAEVDPAGMTIIHVNFGGSDPNKELVEINVRQSVFYPQQPGRNFITVRGFAMRHAATPWAPPTAEQIGLLGTHWSKGWIIEDNTISHSVCTGITLGKHGDEHDNQSANSAEGYVETIKRAHAFKIPWTREHIGHHVVRNNTISHCEQAGIVGSLGAAFSTVTGNTIHEIHVRRLFGGAEMAAIKFHAAIDTTVSHNRVFRTFRALWLDWMSQGTRVTANLFYLNHDSDLFVEVNHGPFMVDNNLLLSPVSMLDWSQGGAFAHNLFAGAIVSRSETNRKTPYHPSHSTEVAGLSVIQGGDNRYYNNLFAKGPRPGGLAVYNDRKHPLQTGGNLYDPEVSAYGREQDATTHSIELKPKLVEEDGHVYLHIHAGDEIRAAKTSLVTTEMLGRAIVPDLPFVNPDGSSITIDSDYAEDRRDAKRPTAGPFEKLDPGEHKIKVW